MQSEREVSPSSNSIKYNPEIPSSKIDEGKDQFPFNDAYGIEGENALGLPPLSADSIGSDKEDLAELNSPPLAVENYQSNDTSNKNNEQKVDSLNDSTAEQTDEFSNKTNLSLFDEHTNTTARKVAFGVGISVQMEGLAKAIKEAQANMPEVEIAEIPKPVSNKLSWNEKKPPIDSLLSSGKKNIPVPTELFSTSHQPIADANEDLQASIGIVKDASKLPKYTDHQYGRLPEQDEQLSGFERLSGSPKEYPSKLKLKQTEQYNDPNTKFARIISDTGVKETRTGDDFSTLETTYKNDGGLLTEQFDPYRRRLSELHENYGEDGEFSYKLTQYKYNSTGKARPFPESSRVISYENGVASIQEFDLKSAKPKLLNERSWQA